MRSISANQRFIFNSDEHNETLHLIPSVLISDILLNLQCNQELFKTFTLKAIYCNAQGICFECPYVDFPVQFKEMVLIAPKNEKTDIIISSFIKFEYEESKVATEHSNGVVAFHIEAFEITEGERIFYTENN